MIKLDMFWAAQSVAQHQKTIKLYCSPTLEALHNQAALSEQGCIDSVNWSLYEEDGRIKVTFDAIPSEEVRKVLKSNGFKWSRYSKAWVRKITANAVATTRYMIQQLNEF